MATLREYARYFAGSDGFQSDDFARGIVSLERNWEGPLAANNSVDATLQFFEKMQQTATPAQSSNWRFEAALYRAFTDAYERHRLLIATAQEQRALGSLAAADRAGPARGPSETGPGSTPIRRSSHRLGPGGMPSKIWPAGSFTTSGCN